MPTSAHSILPLQSSSPIQLYRHILRECSYLPPAFRDSIVTTIKKRFHNHRERDVRPQQHIRRANNVLRTLRAANCGDKAAMEGLISKGFGRAGSRRRELMTNFVLSQGPKNSQMLETFLNPIEDIEEKNRADADAKDSPGPAPDAPLSKAAFYEKWDQPKLLRAMSSQRQQQREGKGAASWRSSAVKSLNPDSLIPEKTIWGTPPSEILKRAKRSKWWKRSASKLMPPLGKGEWDLLQKLSLGGQDSIEWAIPERRAPAKSWASDVGTAVSEWKWRDHATRPTARVERPKSLTHQRRSGQKDGNPYGVGDRDRVLSPRWFQRVYNRTWQHTPTMTQDPNTLRYTFAWGHAGAKLPCATKQQLEIFQGVNEKGRKIQAS